MTLAAVSVARYELWVDGADTVRAVLDSADTGGGAPLTEALELAATECDVFVVAPSVELCAADFLPGGVADVRAVVSATTVDGVLSALGRAGYVSVHPVWSETASEAYLSTGRVLVAVQVLRDFTLAAMSYGWSDPYAEGPADRCEITQRSCPVGPGWYVVGMVGDCSCTLVGAARVDVDDSADPGETAERLTYWAVEIEGFGASCCSAGCDSCHGRWFAEGGSWHFTAEHGAAGTADGWDFDDVEDFDARGTVACPACRCGRVGFSIF